MLETFARDRSIEWLIIIYIVIKGIDMMEQLEMAQ